MEIVLFFAALLFFWITLTTLLFWGLKKKGGSANEYLDKQVDKTVSVVVAARNEAENLKQLIPALLKQKYPCFEVIIIDDRSTDGSSDILSGYAQTDARLRPVFVEEKNPNHDGKKNALMQGVAAARYEVLLLIDADCLPKSPNWIQKMAAPFTLPSVQIVLGYSPYRLRTGWLNGLIQLETLLTAFHYLGSAGLGKPYMGVGRNLAYRRSFFMEKQGLTRWIRHTGGDDDLFVGQWAEAKNTTFVLEEEAHTISVPKTSLQDWIQQKHRHLSAGKAYRLKHKLWTGVWQFLYLSSWAGLTFTLALSPENQGLLLFLLLFRYAYWSIIWKGVKKRLNSSFPLYFVFTFEFIYLLYYTILGIYTLHSKRPTWTQNEKKHFLKKH